MYVCMYVCMYVYICIYVYISVYTDISKRGGLLLTVDVRQFRTVGFLESYHGSENYLCVLSKAADVFGPTFLELNYKQEPRNPKT